MKQKINYYKDKISNNRFYNNLFKNSFWAFAGDASASVINLVVTILLIKLIGNNDYGILVLAQSYMSVMDVLLNIQSWKSVIQYGQKSLVNNDVESLNQYVKLGYILDISTAILGGVVSILLAGVIGRIFGWSSELIFCARIFSVTIFSHFAGTTIAILRILNKFNLVAIQKFLTALVKLISLIVVMILFKNVNLTIATLIYCGIDILGNILLVIFAMHVYRKKYGLKEIIKSKKPKDSKEFINFTIWGTLGEIVDIPVNYFDVFILSLLGNEIVAVFKVYKQCVAILQKVTAPIQQSIMPQFSELIAKGNKKQGYHVVLKIRNVIIKIIGPASLVIGLSSPLWLKIIYGDIYANYWWVLLIYLIIQTYALSYTTIHPYYLTLDKAKNSTLYVLFANIIYMLLALILVNIIGIIGIVLAYMVQCNTVILLKRKDIIKSVN